MPKEQNHQPTAKQPVPPKTDKHMFAKPPKADPAIRDPGAFKSKAPS